jgi:hypothetical protein
MSLGFLCRLQKVKFSCKWLFPADLEIFYFI